MGVVGKFRWQSNNPLAPPGIRLRPALRNHLNRQISWIARESFWSGLPFKSMTYRCLIFWAIKISNETPLSSSFVWDFRVEFGMDGWAWFAWIWRFPESCRCRQTTEWPCISPNSWMWSGVDETPLDSSFVYPNDSEVWHGWHGLLAYFMTWD